MLVGITIFAFFHHSKNHFQSLKDSGVDDFYGTYYWASIIGYNYEFSRLLGYYCNYVDTIYSSVRKNWRECDKWHFYTMDEQDVRGEISYEQRTYSINYLISATNFYNRWNSYKSVYGLNNELTQRQLSSYQDSMINAIMFLGYSLHPIQESFAHTREYCKQFPNKRWFHLPINVDKASQHIYEVLGPTASITLEILLTFYNSYYILRLQKSYFL